MLQITRHIRMIKSYRVHRGPEAPASTDHHAVIATMAILPHFNNRKTSIHSFDVQRIREDDKVTAAFNTALHNKFEAISDLPEDVDQAWKVIGLTDDYHYRLPVRQLASENHEDNPG